MNTRYWDKLTSLFIGLFGGMQLQKIINENPNLSLWIRGLILIIAIIFLIIYFIQKKNNSSRK